MYTELYSEFKKRCPDLLHFAAHSHHPWPDVSRKAQLEYWDFSMSRLDRKWGPIFSEVIPELQRLIAEILGVSDPSSLCFAPNTHEFVARLLSSFVENTSFSILTTDGEFHSFRRQAERYEELPGVTVTRIPVFPAESFATRFLQEAQDGNGGRPYDVAFFSHVFFLSGQKVSDLNELALQLSGVCSTVVVDGYHSFCAVPQNIGVVQEKIFFLGGGYKYAQGGEGACFMHVPQETTLRPLNTGWFAEFEELEQSAVKGKVSFGVGAERFWGSTFDASGLYRMRAVLSLFRDEGISVEKRHAYVKELQQYFLERLNAQGADFVLQRDMLLVNDLAQTGHFLAFQCGRAGELHKAWQKKGIQVDVRGDVLRVGFGIYQTQQDVDDFFTRTS